MKKVKLVLSTMLVLGGLIGCDTGSASSSSSSSSSSSMSSEVSSQETDVFQTMLNQVSGNNVTFQSYYNIYTYSNSNPSAVENLQEFDITAKITENVYEMVAYIKGTNNIASSARLECDGDGDVVRRHINLHNEIVTEKDVDGRGQSYKWLESVYHNQIGRFKSNEFTPNDEGDYVYNGNLEDVPLDIIHAAVPLSGFELETFTVNVEDNKIESFIFQEKETSQVYAGYMYGRRIELAFENIGTTVCEPVTPYAESGDNTSLKDALSKIKGATNYTIDVEAFYEDGTQSLLQQALVTLSDLYIENHSGGVDTAYGLHTVNEGSVYEFNSFQDQLLGTPFAGSVQDVMPTFDFSENVFYLKETLEDGTKCYVPYPEMSEVLNYIEFSDGYVSEYYYLGGDIVFAVANETLSYIEFPRYIIEDNAPVLVTNRLTYKNVGSTVIADSTWDTFTTESLQGPTSWDDALLTLDFSISETETREMTIAEVFEKTLGSKTAIPFFLTSSILYDVEGNYSADDDCVFLALYSVSMVSQNVVNTMGSTLTSQGFIKEPIDDGIDNYEKDGISIIFAYQEGGLIIEFTLPVGNILD